ncbi:MAG: Spx/MgsR family RNA polymerase-binding regulatory protein [Bacillota bacterium]|nr:Spx/MgsR family RNA polymerase-binding regulatory protein [Bacillota bacterium]
MLLICYKKCTTCRKLEKILQEKNVEYEYRQIDQENPTAKELKVWHKKTDLDIINFFNTRGKIYRELNLKEKLPQMSLEEKYEILATDGMLVKRPILLNDDQVYVGPEVTEFIRNI